MSIIYMYVCYIYNCMIFIYIFTNIRTSHRILMEAGQESCRFGFLDPCTKNFLGIQWVSNPSIENQRVSTPAQSFVVQIKYVL